MTLEAFRIAFDQDDLAQAERLAPTLLVPAHEIDVLTRLALLRRRKGLPAQAVDAFLDARRRAAGRPLPPWFASELAGCHTDRRDWPAALETAEAGLPAKPMLGLVAASALLHLGQPEAARTRLRHAIHALGPDPARAQPIADLCTRLLAADPSHPARAVVAEAAALNPGAAAFGRLRLDLAITAGHWREALLQSDPDDEVTLARCFDHLAATLPPEDIDAQLATLQDGMPLRPALLLHLARRLPLPGLHRRFAARIAAWQATPATLACQAWLDSLCTFQSGTPDVPKTFLALSDAQRRAFCLLRPLHTLRLRDRRPEDLARLAAAGIDPEAAITALEALAGPPAPSWAAYLETAAYASPDARRIVHADESFTAFQDRIVADRAFTLAGPLGADADLFDSVKIHDRQVFAFRGKQLMLVHTGGNMNFAVAIHLPGPNILMPVDGTAAPSKQAFYGAPPYLAETMALWLRRAAHSPAAYHQAAATAPAARTTTRRIVAIHGRAENPAHHVWNYLPPFERLALAGTLANLAEMIPPPTLYFGPLAQLFPELASTPHRDLPESAFIDPCPFDPASVALQLGSSFIPRPLMARIHAWAERHAPPPDREGRTPLVWIGLRVGDKVWVDQTQGVAHLIDLVMPLYPEALFVLDGFSLPPDTQSIPEKWAAAAASLHRIAADIAARTAHPSAVRSLVGNTLAESVRWARAADAYFAPLGSSQHKVGWYGQAQGLIYTTPILARTPPGARQGAWEAEGAPQPRFLIGTVAGPGTRRNAHDFRNNLETIAFTPEAAARRLLAILGAGALDG